MTKIVSSKDCGNSPKNLLVQSLAVAIEKADREAFSGCVSEDVLWTYPGHPTSKGVSDASSQLPSLRRQAPARIEVEHAISHGRAGAANGKVQLTSGATFRFCHVIEFASIKGDRVAKITSFYEDHETHPESK